MAEPIAIGDNAITLKDDALILRFPTPERFRDVLVTGLYTSPENSDAGLVKVRSWTLGEVTRYEARHGRWRRFGRHVLSVIRWMQRDPMANGLVQRAARRLDVPLYEPADRSTLISNCTVMR